MTLMSIRIVYIIEEKIATVLCSAIRYCKSYTYYDIISANEAQVREEVKSDLVRSYLTENDYAFRSFILSDVPFRHTLQLLTASGALAPFIDAYPEQINQI